MYIQMMIHLDYPRHIHRPHRHLGPVLENRVPNLWHVLANLDWTLWTNAQWKNSESCLCASRTSQRIAPRMFDFVGRLRGSCASSVRRMMSRERKPNRSAETKRDCQFDWPKNNVRSYPLRNGTYFWHRSRSHLTDCFGRYN